MHYCHCAKSSNEGLLSQLGLYCQIMLACRIKLNLTCLIMVGMSYQSRLNSMQHIWFSPLLKICPCYKSSLYLIQSAWVFSWGCYQWSLQIRIHSTLFPKRNVTFKNLRFFWGRVYHENEITFKIETGESFSILDPDRYYSDTCFPSCYICLEWVLPTYFKFFNRRGNVPFLISTFGHILYEIFRQFTTTQFLQKQTNKYL